MNRLEYQVLQDKLNKKLTSCNGLTGKSREGYVEAILNVKSMVHEVYHRDLEDIICQDCKWRSTVTSAFGIPIKICNHPFGGISKGVEINDEDYCSYGESK